jgi:hypothetical protein
MPPIILTVAQVGQARHVLAVVMAARLIRRVEIDATVAIVA